jgi:hypothetical protein
MAVSVLFWYNKLLKTYKMTKGVKSGGLVVSSLW